MAGELWHSDIEITEILVKNSIESQFSQLAPLTDIKLIGEGWDNKVFLINCDYIFRFPRRKVAVELLGRENIILHYLQNKIDLDIPNPIFIGQPSQHYPYPFQGYQMIHGTSGCYAKLTADERISSLKPLALFLKQLHSIGEKQALSIGANSQVFDRTQVENIIPQIQERANKINAKKIVILNTNVLQNEISKVRNITLPMNNNVLVHGDLYSLHLMFQDKKLTGIIDWGDVGINNRAVDLAIIFSFFPQSCHKEFLDAYGEVESNTWHYARFLGLYSATTVLLYAHDKNDKLLVHEAIHAIQRINADIISPH
tara:strand:- start:1090 stop:2028 length:939 start_codon:yes stop_codon:yes gene_type:complete